MGLKQQLKGLRCNCPFQTFSCLWEKAHAMETWKRHGAKGGIALGNALCMNERAGRNESCLWCISLTLKTESLILVCWKTQSCCEVFWQRCLGRVGEEENDCVSEHCSHINIQKQTQELPYLWGLKPPYLRTERKKERQKSTSYQTARHWLLLFFFCFPIQYALHAKASHLKNIFCFEWRHLFSTGPQKFFFCKRERSRIKVLGLLCQCSIIQPGKMFYLQYNKPLAENFPRLEISQGRILSAALSFLWQPISRPTPNIALHSFST